MTNIVNLSNLLGNLQPKVLGKSDLMKFTQDTLIISCHLYRKFGGGKQRFSVDFRKVYDDLTSPDAELAELVEKHFLHQIMLTELRGGKVSPFQTSVRNYLEGDRYTIKSDNMGMIYRLPEFYYRDLKFDNMIETHFPGIKPERKMVDRIIGGGQSLVEVRPVESILFNTRPAALCQYWFKMNYANLVDFPLMVSVNQNNPLRYLWEREFNTMSSGTIQLNYCIAKQHPADLVYVYSNNWTLVESVVK